MTQKFASRADGNAAEGLYAQIDALKLQLFAIERLKVGQRLTIATEFGFRLITLPCDQPFIDRLDTWNANQVWAAKNALIELGFDPDACSEPERPHPQGEHR